MEQNNEKSFFLTKDYILLVLLALVLEGGIILMPIFIFPGMFFVTVPVVLLYLRYDFKGNIIPVLFSIALFTAFSGLEISIVYTLLIYSVGIIFGYCIKSNQKVSRTILYITTTILIAIVLCFLTIGLLNSDGFMGMYNYLNSIVVTVTESFKSVRAMYASMGFTKDQLDMVDSIIKGFTTDSLIMAAPGFLVWYSLFIGVLEYFICGAIIKARKYKIRAAEPIEKVYVDNRIAGIIIIFVCLGIILDVKNIAVAAYISSFFQQIMVIVFTLDGVALVTYFLKNKLKSKKSMIIITYVMMFIFQLEVPLILIGIIDAIVDFRKIDPNRLFKR